MNSAAEVKDQLTNWQTMGMTKEEIVIALAEACMGWPYVWGGYGQLCSAANRRSYANRSSCPEAEAEQIRKKCQAVSGKISTCNGCKYFPGGRTRFFDCRGFTRWLLQQVGISLQGAGATSQWNTASNWAEKGLIANIPQDKVCCVFMANGKKMSHTGMHVGGGVIIHCSGEVKRGKITDRGWTHYAIPAGLMQQDKVRPLLRKGSRGDAVKELQEILIAKGYDLGKWGADGVFGKQTQKAVKAFQKAEGLKADGIVGPLTYGKLYPKEAG